MDSKPNLPVFDLHCDLLSYLARNEDTHFDNTEEIGCALPFLKKGNVRLQVCAIYSGVEPGSTAYAHQQSMIFKKLGVSYAHNFILLKDAITLAELPHSEKIGLVASIENAAGFMTEDEKLDKAFSKFQTIIDNVGRVLYIGITHHTENRFGGGNMAPEVGLKEDGKHLLEFLNDKGIAIDFSHASDALAYDVLEFIEKKSLKLPVLASHSNFRGVWNHPRNLPDELAKEISRRGGIIGINFLRAYVHDRHAEALYDHINYGIDLCGRNAIALGADYFYTKDHPDKSRIPFYFEEHATAAQYPPILKRLAQDHNQDQLEHIAYRNAFDFINRIWKG